MTTDVSIGDDDEDEGEGGFRFEVGEGSGSEVLSGDDDGDGETTTRETRGTVGRKSESSLLLEDERRRALRKFWTGETSLALANELCESGESTAAPAVFMELMRD
jgi:hypothetical protein